MVWHLVKPILSSLSKPYRLIAQEHAQAESTLKESVKNCVAETNSLLGFGAGYLFVKELENKGHYNYNKVSNYITATI